MNCQVHKNIKRSGTYWRGDFSDPTLIDAVEGHIVAMGDSTDIGDSLSELVQVVAATGHVQRALRIARSIRSPLERSVGLRHAARALARAGDQDQAVAVLREAVAAVEELSTSNDDPNPLYQGTEVIDWFVGNVHEKADYLDPIARAFFKLGPR